MKKRKNKFNRVKEQKQNNPENYKRTYYLKRKKGGGSNPLLGMAYKLQHLNRILGYTAECDDTWQAMPPEQIKEYEDERKRLIEILTPIHLEYNRKHFSKTFHKEEES